jgi:hypothetical protein
MCGFSGRVDTVLAPTRVSARGLELSRMQRVERANVVDNIVVYVRDDVELQWRID